jgi:Zn-dependent M16 (insulinase) family peptidase
MLDMRAGTICRGFEVKRVRELPELQARLWELEHRKTGAELCWLERDDENKAFSIAFKTLPEDSTGVFHILEHSVLCGSDKYPVKEPFVELLKTSLQTFLNAMTYPDKTVYPVSSRNDRDFLNLMDVYLDAVFHPAIYHRPEIFRQEGWRYEGEGEELCYQGVVLNEMKGAYSSPATVLENEMDKLLFPDNCYRHVSGGDPEQIVDLTYEQFLDSHRKYYHPSNARISLVGSVDPAAALEKLDGYLSGFERREIRFDIPMQDPVAAVTKTVPYEIGPEEPLTGKAIVSCGTLLGRFDDRERNFAASILADYLTGDNDAPLKRAILDAGLGEDASVAIHDGTQQEWISWEVWNTDADRLPDVRRTVRETLERIAAEGLDRRRLRACYNHFAFELRDRDGGSLPRSLGETLDLLDSWLYGGDPADGVLVEEPLQAVADSLETDAFADLIRELFLDESRSVTVVLTPSHTLGEERADREAARLAAESAGWTEERRAELRRRAEALALWQQTPDSDEALATIPVLRLSDLRERPEALPMTMTERDGVPVLRHALDTELVTVKVFFNAADLSLEELPTLAALAMLLGVAGTKRRSGEELQMCAKEHMGSLSICPAVYNGSDPGCCRVLLSAYFTSLAEEAEASAELLREILTETVFTDRKVLRDLLKQSAMGAQMALSANGHRYAAGRVSGSLTAAGAAREYTGGVELARRIKELAAADDAALDDLLAAAERMARRLMTRDRLTVSCSANAPEELAAEMIGAFPLTGERPPEEAAYMPLDTGREGLVVPAQVGFAVKGTNLQRHGKDFSGSIPVLAGVLNYMYLWSEIRVRGGAYGCGFSGRDDGNVFYYTYRDPQPGRSLEVMDRAADFIRDFCADDPDLTGYVLSAVCTLDPLLPEADKMSVAENRYFKGITYEEVCRLYDQLVRTTPADLLELCGALELITADDAVCVVAGQSLMDGCAGALDTVRQAL